MLSVLYQFAVLPSTLTVELAQLLQDFSLGRLLKICEDGARCAFQKNTDPKVVYRRKNCKTAGPLPMEALFMVPSLRFPKRCFVSGERDWMLAFFCIKCQAGLLQFWLASVITGQPALACPVLAASHALCLVGTVD